VAIALPWKVALAAIYTRMTLRAKNAPSFPRGPLDLAPISSPTRLASFGSSKATNRIPRIQRSRCAIQSAQTGG